MLVLLFELGADRYALDVKHVVEVLPLVDLRPVPGSERLAGLFDFRGTPVPVIDLARLTFGRPSAQRLSTRVIVVSDVDGGTTQALGVIAERVTETTHRPASDFVWSAGQNERLPWLGPVATDARGLLQLIDVRHLPWPSPISKAS